MKTEKCLNDRWAIFLGSRYFCVIPTVVLDFDNRIIEATWLSAGINYFWGKYV